MKLYYSPGTCSLSPHIVFREAGLDVQLEKVDLGTHKTADGRDYYSINPKGPVPALALDDGTLLTEGVAIVQYLADQHPASKLAPENGTLPRYQLQAWLNYISTELHKSFGILFNRTAPADFKAATIASIGTRFDYLVTALDSHPYLTGDDFSVADAYLFTMLTWTGPMKIDLGRWPVLQAYFRRISERPAVQQALIAEGLRQ